MKRLPAALAATLMFLAVPATAFADAPAAPSVTSQPSAWTNSTSASFSFSGGEVGGSFTCSLDGGAYEACDSSKTYTGLEEGSHTFDVKQVDAAGNSGDAATLSWVVDLTPPAKPGLNNMSWFNKFRGHPYSEVYFQAGADSAFGGYVCSVDGAPYVPCDQLPNTSIWGSSGSYSGGDWVGFFEPGDGTHPWDGPHMFGVKQVDEAGNESAAEETAWTIDHVGPDAPVVLSGPAGRTNSTSAEFSFSGEAGARSWCLNGPEVDPTTGQYARWDECSSPWSLSGLGEGDHEAHFRLTDDWGNWSSMTTVQWTVDLTPPAAPTITDKPAAWTNSTSASFSFSGGEVGGSFTCSLDGGAYEACDSSKTYTGLEEGSHTFDVKQVDAAGNSGDAATLSWVVDLTPPAKPGLNNMSWFNKFRGHPYSEVYFQAGADSAFGGYVCSVDGAPYVPCDQLPNTSIWGSSGSYSGGDWVGFFEPGDGTHPWDGPHMFGVKQVDEAGNESAAEETAWTIDHVGPDAPVVLSGPAGRTNSTSAEFSFSGEAGARSWCLNGPEVDPTTGQYARWDECSSPWSLSGLGEGDHEAHFRLTDDWGNWSSMTTVQWTVDLTPPAAPTITSKPAARSNSASATFGFSGDEVDGSFVCSLDSGAFAACDASKTFTGLADGGHTLDVKQVDQAGNRSDATSATWTVHATAPGRPSLSGAPAARTNSTSASIGFTGAADSTFTCSVDGGAYGDCSSPVTLSDLAEGTHSVAVKQTDTDGNTSLTATATWVVDVTAPTAPTVTSRPAALSNSRTPSIGLSGEPSATFTCSVDGGSFASCSNPAKQSLLADGSHTFSVRQTDVAGNVSAASTPIIWTVDATAPSAPVLTGVPAAKTNLKSARIVFTGPGDAVLTCSLDRAAPSSCATAKSLAALAEGTHTFTVTSTDAAGNTSATTATWLVDTTGPKLQSLPGTSKVKTKTQTSYVLKPAADPSGFAKAEYSTATASPSASAKSVTSRTVTYAATVVFKTSSTIKWVRVQDGAGNWSAWYRG